MNQLCSDIAWKSINHEGELLCGDHVELVSQGENSSVLVLADGLGSGVKASILSTLTSRMLSTMLAEGLSITECVKTIAATLPICSVRGTAYSTFTILRLIDQETAELIQYDNPPVILLRNFRQMEYPSEELMIEGKKVTHSVFRLMENDILIAMSDGCPHAGIGRAYNFGFQQKDIVSFMETFAPVGYTAKTLSTLLIDECNKKYESHPGDDATACVIKIRKREPVNLLFGPPRNRDDADRMMSLFFSKEGKHIICGGTTSEIAAAYLKKPLVPSLKFIRPEIPPTACIDGVDLVTEGVITIHQVLLYAKDMLHQNERYEEWSVERDGASLICRLLFEEATDINFYVGRAVNPAHQNPELPIHFNIKMNLIEELSECLRQMGKQIKVSYF